MAAASLSPQMSRQIFLALKTEMETEKERLQASVLPFRQKLGEPAPSASNPALQMKLNKAYRTYQKIMSAIINKYQEMEDLCQNQINFLARSIDYLGTSKINVNVNHVLESFRSQMQPLEDQVAQLQRNLQAERGAMIILTHDQGNI